MEIVLFFLRILKNSKLLLKVKEIYRYNTTKVRIIFVILCLII